MGDAGSPGAFPCWFIFSDGKVLKHLSLSLFPDAFIWETQNSLGVHPEDPEEAYQWRRICPLQGFNFSKFVAKVRKALGRCYAIILTLQKNKQTKKNPKPSLGASGTG